MIDFFWELVALLEDEGGQPILAYFDECVFRLFASLLTFADQYCPLDNSSVMATFRLLAPTVVQTQKLPYLVPLQRSKHRGLPRRLGCRLMVELKVVTSDRMDRICFTPTLVCIP